MATVGHDHTHCEANILFDEGAQRSFITQTLADQLSISHTESDSIALSAFGAHSSSNRQLPVATVKVVTAYDEKVPVRVLVVEQIATPIQNQFHQQIHDIPHLRGLTFAHPVTSDENFVISLLIGADPYWDLVEDTFIRGQGPTAVASKLGYLVSEPLQTDIVHPADTVVNLLQTLSSTREAEFDLQQFSSLDPHLLIRTNMNSFFKTIKALQLQETLIAVTAPNFHGKRTLRHYQLTMVTAFAAHDLWFVVLPRLLSFLNPMAR